MGHNERSTTQSPFRIATVQGEPYNIAGRRLIPIVRAVSFGKARATVGRNHVGGWGGGFVQITPVAMIEETVEGRQRISITDATSRALWGMVAAGAAIALLFTAVRWLARNWRARDANG